MQTKPVAAVSKTALRIQTAIIDRLKTLVKKQHATCLCQEFKRDYAHIMNLFQRYQKEILFVNNITVTCTKGCGVCCYHWAEDVYSFEVLRIVDFIKKYEPLRLKAINARLRGDVDQMQLLRKATRTAPTEVSAGKKTDPIDPYDIALSAFYQLKRPCPLLGSDGACTVYALRPLTCRIYVSFSPQKYCLPRFISSEATKTYLLDMENCAMELFDRLHFMYDRCDGDTSLRSMLLKLLN
ncbi:MAG TPA: YkgJ family cysteine cluster protein [Chitinivibrionales bacterium]